MRDRMTVVWGAISVIWTSRGRAAAVFDIRAFRE
jgi:hypothetical protein